MDSALSTVSSLKDDCTPLYVQPHYKESYRLAIYALLCGGTEAYEEFLRAEQICHFLSEQEIAFILENAELPVIEDEAESKVDQVCQENSGVSTYFPTESDEEIPDLDLGWPEVPLEETDTSISVLFNPPRQDTPTIKEVVRKQIQDAVQLIAVSMDVFTDVDIFKELVTAALRGVVVYILLDQTHFSSFIHMAQRLGLSLSEIKTIRVRTVQGLQYQCQSSIKFHGALEQKFLLIDCRTVLYGSYSYTWTYEKLNLSMMLVITGQLVSSYDEEFRRLYARSTVPPLLAREKLHPVHYLHSPSSSQLSLQQLQVKNKAINGIRDDRFNNNMLTRGVSIQDRLHHFPDMGNLVRGHSYGGELQKLNSITRLRMGTKDFGLERHGSILRPNELQNKSLQQHLRHQSRYGADHNLIPFNSETSLNKWKMDTYLNAPLDASHEALSPVGSPYCSYTGLNELHSQNIHLRSKDIRQRMEEMRQKRLSLQEYTNLQQSQESLRMMYLTQERQKIRSRGMELRQSAADLEALAHQTDHRIQRELGLTDGKRSLSHNDFKTMTDRKLLAYDWRESVSRSASDLDLKANDSVGKLGLGPKHQRHMESLTEIPEEKDASSRVNSSDLVPQKEELTGKDNKVVSFEEQTDLEKDCQGSTSKMVDSPAKESKKSTQSEGANGPKKKVPQQSDTGLKEAEKVQEVSTLPRRNSKDVEKTQDALTLSRKNSAKSKVSTISTPDEKKPGKKDSLQRKSSLRLQKLSGSNQSLRTESSSSPMEKQEQMSKKSLKSTLSSSEDKGKSPLNRFSPQRLSKRKTDSDKGSKSVQKDEVSASFEAKKEKAYSRYEYSVGKEDKGSRGVFNVDDRSAMNRQSDGTYQMFSQTQNTGENKIGRFMQKMGNLIGKSK